MQNHKSRREFLQKIGLISLAAGSGTFLPVESFGNDSVIVVEDHDLASLPTKDLFSVLDMELPELAPVRKALERKGYKQALSALLDYYRSRYPEPSGIKNGVVTERSKNSVTRGDKLAKHIFQWGPYEEAAYGEDINWAADPAGDIEWVAAVYRFYWANDLSEAYKATGDDIYVQTFVELTSDWIKKHPLEETVDIAHPVYGWRGYPWLDLQTGIRATNICSAFRLFLHSKAITPEFLGILLSSLYDHQVKTEKMPMNKVHNKAIF